MRVGQGTDVHRLETGEELVLGGVTIPFDKGLTGHSDADVLTHAVMDAMLGAVAIGDIGKHFPDSNAAYRDISSLKLLATTYELVKAENYYLVNLDATIMLERPRLAPYFPQMRQNLARSLAVTQDQISLKATTWEKLGFVGEEAGVMAQAVVLVDNNRKQEMGIH